MILPLSIFTVIIIFGIVGGVAGLTTLVSLLIFEKENDYLKIEKTKTELESLLREAKLSNLTSQVQPHFLFNTLNTISSLVRLNKNDDAEEAIFAIASLLRYTIRDSQQLVDLKDELSIVHMYSKIQKLRFGNRLSWEINNDIKLDYLKIPMLIIQPLVENACIHGIEPQVEGGNIEISTYKYNGEIFIRVIDNGIGMPLSMINHFNGWKQTGKGADNFGIGIKNTYSRLVHYFGINGDLNISSSDVGTSYLISLKEVEELENTFSG